MPGVVRAWRGLGGKEKGPCTSWNLSSRIVGSSPEGLCILLVALSGHPGLDTVPCVGCLNPRGGGREHFGLTGWSPSLGHWNPPHHPLTCAQEGR